MIGTILTLILNHIDIKWPKDKILRIANPYKIEITVKSSHFDSVYTASKYTRIVGKEVYHKKGKTLIKLKVLPLSIKKYGFLGPFNIKIKNRVFKTDSFKYKTESNFKKPANDIKPIIPIIEFPDYFRYLFYIGLLLLLIVLIFIIYYLIIKKHTQKNKNLIKHLHPEDAINMMYSQLNKTKDEFQFADKASYLIRYILEHSLKFNALEYTTYEIKGFIKKDKYEIIKHLKLYDTVRFGKINNILNISKELDFIKYIMEIYYNYYRHKEKMEGKQ